MIQISNQHLIVTMTQEGGTLTSIRDAKTGREYLWQGDPAYWTGQAPNLFPFVGRLYEKTYTLHGKAYPMTIHGFVRHTKTTGEEEQETSTGCLPLPLCLPHPVRSGGAGAAGGLPSGKPV